MLVPARTGVMRHTFVLSEISGPPLSPAIWIFHKEHLRGDNHNKLSILLCLLGLASDSVQYYSVFFTGSDSHTVVGSKLCQQVLKAMLLCV